MRNQAEAPEGNRFTATPYSFTLKLKDRGDSKAARAKPSDALRLVWHDYPGEWFTQEPSSTGEAARRVETFARLLKSDVALVLVDGQKLLDYAGRWFKSSHPDSEMAGHIHLVVSRCPPRRSPASRSRASGSARRS